MNRRYQRCMLSPEYFARFRNSRCGWSKKGRIAPQDRRGWIMNSPDRPSSRYWYVVWDNNINVITYAKDFITPINEWTTDDPTRKKDPDSNPPDAGTSQPGA